MLRKTLIAMVMVVLLGTMVAAESVTITYWTGWGGAELEDIQKNVIDQFMKENPDIKVNTETIFGSYDKLLTAIAAGNPPDVVSALWDYQLPGLAQKGALMPLDDFIAKSKSLDKQDLYPGIVKQSQYNGTTYGLPATTNTAFIVYNKQFFREAGLDPENPPKTLKELEIAADKLTIRDEIGNIKRLGYDATGAGLWTWGHVFGGNFFDHKADRFTINSPKIVEALQWMVDWVDRYGGMKKVQAFVSGLGSYWSPQNPFFTGDVAMAGFGEWIQQFNERYGPVDYGIMAYPCPPGGRENWTTVGGSMFAIPSNSKHPDAAWRFIEYITGPKGSEAMCRVLTNMPPRRSVANKLVKEIPVISFGTKVLENPEVSAGGPLTPVDQLFLDQLTQAVDKALYKEVSPKQALDEAQQAVQSEYEMIDF